MRDNYPNHFEQIYQAALQQDPNLLPKGPYCIDEFMQGHHGLSAAARLASEGKIAEVKWLKQRGANINYIAYGAAIGRHITFARILIKEGADINQVAYGTAKIGHVTLAKTLIKEGADINSVAHGAAEGGHTTWARTLIKEGANFEYAALGAATGGHVTFARALIKEGADIRRVAYGAAAGGHITFTKALIKEGADINQAAYGAAVGGHITLARTFIQEGAHITAIIYGSSVGGHITWARALIKEGGDINDAAFGAAESGHVTFAKTLIEEGADINQVAQGAARGVHISSTNHQVQLHWLLHMTDDKQRHQLAEALSKLEKKIHIKPAILKRASRMARLMSVFGYTYRLALISTSTNVIETTSTQKKSMALNVGALAMLAGMGCQQSAMNKLFILPYEIWINIFECVFNTTLSLQQLDQLSFLTTKLILLNQLTDHKSLFTEKVLTTKNATELANCIRDQYRLLPASSTTTKIDTTQRSSTCADIVCLWHKRLVSPASKSKTENTSKLNREWRT